MTKTATVDAPLLADPPATDSLPAVQPPDVALMFERLASNPAVDPEKLERLIAMQERILRHNAKAAYDAALSEMQGELPIIDERGQIVVNGVVRSRYAKHEDIQAVVKPILSKYGFAINHKNRRLENGVLVIIGTLRHKSGHSEDDEFECPPDDSGSKNDIQAMGSTREYGRRYTTISLLNIVTKNVDDDGNKSGRAQPPDGLEAWWAALEGIASEGLPALEKAWDKSKADFKTYMANHDRSAYPELKKKAQAVKR